MAFFVQTPSAPKMWHANLKKLDKSRCGYHTILFSLYLKTYLYCVKFSKLSFKHCLDNNFLKWATQNSVLVKSTLRIFYPVTNGMISKYCRPSLTINSNFYMHNDDVHYILNILDNKSLTYEIFLFIYLIWFIRKYPN